MASDQPTEHLIDLLYGELTEEEESSLREDIAQSAEMQAELAELEDLFQQVSDTVEVREVPQSLHDSIMAAARESVTSTVEEQARAVRRPPAVAAGGDSRGFWGRMKGGQASQIALVAAVLLAGAFVFRFVSMSDPAAPMAKYESEAMPSLLERKEADEAPGVAMPKMEPPAAAEEEIFEGESAARELAADERVLEKVAEKPAAAQPSAKDSPRPEVIARPSKKSVPKKKAKPRTSSKSAKGSAIADIWTEEQKQEAPAPAPSIDGNAASTDSLTVGAAEDKSNRAGKAKEEFRPAEGSLDAVQESYNRSDFRQTIAQADKVMASGASATDKARALELKAQSYSRLGMLTQADATYRNLQNNYPTYNTGSVRAAREELSRKLNERREPKKRAPRQKKSYDFEAESSPSSLE